MFDPLSQILTKLELIYQEPGLSSVDLMKKKKMPERERDSIASQELDDLYPEFMNVIIANMTTTFFSYPFCVILILNG
jgi:hypothetical protein